jgi:prohibitin 1
MNKLVSGNLAMNIRQAQVPSYVYLGGGIVFIFLAIVLKPFTVINAGERGVIMHFGEVQSEILNEGFHPILPIYTNIKKISVRVRKVDVATKVGTKDLQTLDLNTSINWHIQAERVNHVYQQIGDERQIGETIIIPAISEVLKASTPQRTAEEILKQRTDLKQEIEKALKLRLVKYGIQIDDVSLTKIGFSPEFTRSIELKQIAEQDAKKAEYEALKAAKQAEAEVNRAKGTAEAQKLLKQSLNRDLLQKQAIEKWDGKFPTVMGGNGALPLINIAPPTN